MPASIHPDLLVGFDTRDDAGVFRLSDTQALVQTIDFFTPVVDDPYAFGTIAAANALSDIYAMGGTPVTVLNVACFDPEAAPADVWAAVLCGMADKTAESGAVVLGGHSVEDREPKFGMAVTGFVDPSKMFTNALAKPGDRIYLTKPLGTGIVTTAAKFDGCSAEELDAAVRSMALLNREAATSGLRAGVRCATDITGFGLVGHLWNVARASGVSIEIDANRLPTLPGVERMVGDGFTTAGSVKNRDAVGEALQFDETLASWLRHLVLDPQTSGGLALFTADSIEGATAIGYVSDGSPRIRVRGA